MRFAKQNKNKLLADRNRIDEPTIRCPPLFSSSISLFSKLKQKREFNMKEWLNMLTPFGNFQHDLHHGHSCATCSIESNSDLLRSRRQSRVYIIKLICQRTLRHRYIASITGKKIHEQIATKLWLENGTKGQWTAWLVVLLVLWSGWCIVVHSFLVIFVHR